MKQKMNRKRNIILSFMIPVLVLLEICYYYKIFINGTNSILFSDLSNVYADLLMGLKGEILAGNNILYNWNVGGGIDFIPIITGNLSSLLNLLLFLFPDKYFQEGILGLQVLRVGLSGVNMYLYLSYHFQKNDIKMVGFAVSYGLSAYIICFFQHIMWFDAVMLLPLLVLMTEKLLTGKSIFDFKFVLGLVVLYWSSFYIGYMISIFLFLYSFGFVCKEKIGRKEIFSLILRVVINGVMAAGICSIFLLPTILPLIGAGGLVDIRWYLRCSFTDLLYQMYFGNFNTYLPGGRPLLYCGLFIIILLLVYMKSELVSKREKIVDVILLFVMLFSIEIAPLYFMWHLFDNPDWFEARFSFLLIFYLLLLSYKTVDKWEQVKKKEFLISGFLAGSIFYFCTKIYHDWNQTEMIMNYIGIGVYALFGEGFVRKKRRDMILLLLIVGELTMNANILVRDVLQAESTENYLFYNEYLKQNKEIVSFLEEIDSGFYRMEKDYYRRENDLVAAGGRGISEFSSLFNKKFNHMLRKLGMTAGAKLIRYEGSSLISDALLGIKYVCSQWGYYSVYESVKEIGDKTIFKNQYAFDLGTIVESEITNMDIDTYDNPIVLQNEIMRKMYGKTEDVFQSVEPKEMKLTNLREERMENGKVIYSKINAFEEASIELTMDKRQGYLLYTYFSEHCGEISLWLNDMWISNFFGQTGKVINLENNTYGFDEVTIKILVNGERCELDSKMFYLLDLDAIAEFFKENHFATIEKFSNTNIKLLAETKKKQLLLLSISYDKGWRIKVQGKKVESIPVLGGLMGVELEEGVHEIELNYIPEGFVLGGIWSICFGSSFLFLVVREIQRENERKKACKND